MSADMKAAMEKAEQFTTPSVGFTYSPDVKNLAAAFLELVEESKRWENVFDAQTSELRELRQRAADLQARLDRAEAETIERCWKEAWSKGAPDHIVQAIRALAAAGGQESAATQLAPRHWANQEATVAPSAAPDPALPGLKK